VRVFYSILFICALEVRARAMAMATRERGAARAAMRRRACERARLTGCGRLDAMRDVGFTLVRGSRARTNVGGVERRGARVLHARDGASTFDRVPKVDLWLTLRRLLSVTTRARDARRATRDATRRGDTDARGVFRTHR